MAIDAAHWVDLLDPDEETLRRAFSHPIHHLAMEDILAPSTHDDEPRPKLESHGDYVFGVLLVPVEVTAEDRVFYQEIDLVLTEQQVLTVRKTPPDGAPIDLGGVKET